MTDKRLETLLRGTIKELASDWKGPDGKYFTPDVVYDKLQSVGFTTEEIVKYWDDAPFANPPFDVWAFYYDKDYNIMGAETFYGAYKSLEDAINHAKAIDKPGDGMPEDAKYITIQVEVIMENNDGSTMSVDMAWENTIRK